MQQQGWQATAEGVDMAAQQSTQHRCPRQQLLAL